jgi:O-antigen/teichoic acid export membrane protein
MIGIFLGTTQAGIYTVASRLTELIGFGLVAVNQGAAPMISELYAQGRKEELQRLLKAGALGILAFSLPVALGMLLFGTMMLGLFGEAFIVGYPPLVILTAGQLVNALNTGGGFLMTMTGHEKQAGLLIGLSTIVNVGLNGVLIPLLGIIGAAVATVTATVTWNVCLFIFAQRQLGINPTVWGFRLADTR